jgi:hypothetical protein
MKPTLLLLAFLLCNCLVQAQVPANAEVDATTLSDSIPLNIWAVHKGDDANWSRPDYDDSAWPLLDRRKSWEAQGLGQYDGSFWYRCRVQLPADGQKLALMIHRIATSYEVYVNGRRIGVHGGLPPNPTAIRPLTELFELPADLDRSKPAVIAVRGWMWQPFAPYVSQAPRAVLLGTLLHMKPEKENRRNVFYLEFLPFFVVPFLGCVLAAGLLVLYFTQHRAEYLWLALYLLVKDEFLFNIATAAGASFLWAEPARLFVAAWDDALYLQFVLAFLAIRASRLSVLYQLSLFAAGVLFLYGEWGRLPSASVYTVIEVWRSPLWLGVPVALLWRAWKGNREAALLLGPMVLLNANEIAVTAARILGGSFFPILQVGPVPLRLNIIIGFLFLISIAAVIFYRFNKESKERERISGELEAARSIQQMLIPDPDHETQVYRVESVYDPAHEVGGDFFQLLPAGDGSKLLVVGDVSGKGLKAAMVVSLIVGALRNEKSRRPGEVLSNLNEVLCGRTDAGFVTCCTALFDTGGRVTIANAGHVTPYLGATEVAVESGIPLGIAHAQEYAEFDLTLGPGERLVFLSDGIVEARNARGELYGFERTCGSVAEKAEEIARRAKAFGQEDDITVITVELLAPAY